MSEANKEYLEDKKIFYGKLYRWALLALMIFITFGVIVGVRQVFVVGDRLEQSTNETQRSLRCIGEYFTQTDRANLRIKSINDCTIVRQ